MTRETLLFIAFLPCFLGTWKLGRTSGVRSVGADPESDRLGSILLDQGVL